MWRVEFETPEVEAEVQKMLQRKELDETDRSLIRSWIHQMTLHGPDSIAKDKSWCDHALVGEWWGYRSSSFSNKGRIIYRLVDKTVFVRVARITNTHDYRR